MTVLPLTERAAVLRQAVRALQPHMLARELLPAAKAPRCKSLILLGGRVSLGVAGRPYFAVREQMPGQLEHLAAHCVMQRQQSPMPAGTCGLGRGGPSGTGPGNGGSSTQRQARAGKGTRVYGRAMPRAWGAFVRAPSGNGTRSRQLLPVRARWPP